MKLLNYLSIKNKLFIALASFTLIILLLIVFVFVYVANAVQQQEMTNKAKLELESLSSIYQPIIISGELSNALLLKKELSRLTHIQKLKISDKYNKPVFTYCKENVSPDFPAFFPEKTTAVINSPNILIVDPIISGHKLEGWVTMSCIYTPMVEQAMSFSPIIVFTIFSIFMVALLFAILLHQMLSKPLTKLSTFVETIKHSQCYTLQFNTKRRDEIGLLATEINHLLDNINKRDEFRNRVENELRESEKRFRAMAELMPQPLLETDCNGTISFINKIGLQMFRLPNSEIAKSLSIHTIVESDVNLLDIAKRESLLPMKFFFFDVTCKTTHNQKFPATIYYNPIMKNDQFLGIRAFIVDMSRKAQLEAELSDSRAMLDMVNKSKISYMTMLASEMKTPLMNIAEQSLSLKRESQSTAFAGKALSVAQSCLHLADYIEDMLEMARLDGGQMPFKDDYFDINDMLTDLRGKLMEELRQNGCESANLNFCTSSKVTILIHSDQAKLKKIIRSLVYEHLKTKANEWVTLKYTINEATHSRPEIFFIIDSKTRIKHEDATTSRNGKNEGVTTESMRLTLTKKMVKHLGGDFWVENENKGLSFYFTLPYEPIDINFTSPTHNENHDRRDSVDWTGRRILVAEDEEINFTFIKAALEDTNAEIVWVQNGEEAVKQVSENNNFDAVLMDVRMPVMNGIEATKQIRELKGTSLPIIVQTAFTLSGDRDKCMAAGCDDYLAKPLKQRELIDVIQRNFKQN